MKRETEGWLKDVGRATVASILYLVVILLAAEALFYGRILGVILFSVAVLVAPFAVARVACWVAPTDNRLVLRLGLGAVSGCLVFIAVAYGGLSHFNLRISEGAGAALILGMWSLSIFAGALVFTRWKRPRQARCQPPLIRQPDEGPARLQWKFFASFALANALAGVPITIAVFKRVEGNELNLILGIVLSGVVIPVWITSGVSLWLGKLSGVRRFRQICALNLVYYAILFAGKSANEGSFIEAAATGALGVSNAYLAIVQYRNSMVLTGLLATMYLAALLYSFRALQLRRVRTRNPL